MSIFDDLAVSEAEAEARTQNYSPSVQETTEETPDQVDNGPISESERAALDAAQQTTFQSPFGDTGNQHVRVSDGRVTTFIPPSDEWVHPKVRDRQKQQMALPSFATINDLDARVAAVMRFDGAPKAVSDLAQKARLAIGQAREIRNDASHPDNPRYTRSLDAKDEVVKAIASATALVGALERQARESKDEWFANLTGDLDKQRDAALKAVKAAEKAYAAFRSNVGAAQALAIEAGMWDKDWHSGKTREHELNAPITAMRAAVGFLQSEDDMESGRFLTEEYEGIPPHTLARLQRAAEVAGGGSYAEQLYFRAKSPMLHDKDLHDAIASKRIIPFKNSSPITTDLIGQRAEDE